MDSISNTVAGKILDWEGKYHEHPNVIYVGDEEWRKICNSSSTLIFIDRDEYKWFGLTVFKVDRRNHLSLGVM